MLIYFIKRLSFIVPLLIGISLLSFLIIHLAPGDPTPLGQELSPKISYQARERLKKLYDLDQPMLTQYRKWLKRMATFDFGRSFIDDQKVSQKILKRLPVTLTINVLSLFLILIISIPLGLVSALRQNSFFDKAATVFVFIGFATPTFWLALLLMMFFGIKLGWLPIAGLTSLNFPDLALGGKILDLTRHLTLPVLVSAFTGLAGLSRYSRNNMLEVIRQDYIRTARAKGVGEGRIIFKHAFKNAMLPIITILGLSIPSLVGGAVIFETIFAIPGMGLLFWESVMARDYPVVMGLVVIGALLTQLGILLSDLVYAWADPRIRYK